MPEEAPMPFFGLKRGALTNATSIAQGTGKYPYPFGKPVLLAGERDTKVSPAPCDPGSLAGERAVAAFED
jgi:hypothetical protein